jgi:hypothetical protein
MAGDVSRSPAQHSERVILFAYKQGHFSYELFDLTHRLTAVTVPVRVYSSKPRPELCL